MEHEEIGRFELTETVAKRWAQQGLMLLAVSLPFFLLLPFLSRRGVNWSFHWYTVPLNLILTVGLFVLHELIHGLIIHISGAKARYTFGVKEGLPFLATTTESLLTVGQYKAVALAPTVMITTLGAAALLLIPGTALLAAFPLAIHTSGTVGDLSILRTIQNYPKDSYIKDDLTGYRVFRQNGQKSV